MRGCAGRAGAALQCRTYVTTLLACLLAGAVFAKSPPLELVGVGYHLYYWPEVASQAAEVVPAVQTALPRLQHALGLASSGRLDIYLARSGAEFRQLTGGSNPDMVLGVALPERRRIVLQPLRGEALRRLVVHELAHVLLADKVAETGAQPPDWLHEGLAKYASDDFTMSDRGLLTDAVNDGRLIPLAELDQAFRGSPERVSLAYAESYSLVDFLAGLDPSAGLTPFLRELGQVGDVSRALLRAYNLSPQAFADQWHEHMVVQYLGRSNEEQATSWIWAAMVVLFLLMFVHLRRRAAAIRRQMEEEDRQQQRMSMWDMRAREPEGAGHDDEEGASL